MLYGTCADGRDLAPAEVRESILALMRANWGLGSKLLNGIFIPDPSAAEVQTLARIQRECASAAVAVEMLEVNYGTDVRPLLPAIQARTAVLHREADPATAFRLGREVAALIPGATLIPLPGSSHLFYHGPWAEVLAPVLAFLSEGEPAAQPQPSEPRPGRREPEIAGLRLTGRELEVASLVATGLTNHAIARRLSIAPRTAEAHVENIRRKLGVRSRAQIAAWVTEHRLSSGPPR